MDSGLGGGVRFVAGGNVLVFVTTVYHSVGSDLIFLGTPHLYGPFVEIFCLHTHTIH